MADFVVERPALIRFGHGICRPNKQTVQLPELRPRRLTLSAVHVVKSPKTRLRRSGKKAELVPTAYPELAKGQGF
jgi:hypothetical protein